MFGAKLSDPRFEENRNVWNLKTVVGPDDSILIEVTQSTQTKQFKPYEISSHVLKELVALAKKSQSAPSNRLVITVPEDLTAIQREETAKAARRTGLQVLRILTEPTAAAFAFAREKKFTRKNTIFVFDFGSCGSTWQP
jgi:molecular chaperone DnaK (HSP70)